MIKLNKELNSTLDKLNSTIFYSLREEKFPDKELKNYKIADPDDRVSRRLIDNKIGLFFLSKDEKFLVILGSKALIRGNKFFNFAQFFYKDENIWRKFNSYNFKQVPSDDKKQLIFNSFKIRNLLKTIAKEDLKIKDFAMRLRNIDVLLKKTY